MGRYYAVAFSAVAVSAAQDLFELTAPANGAARIRLHEIRLIQTSDVASADSEVLRVTVKRGTSATTSGSGGSAPTPAPLESGDPAATFAAEVNNTTQMSGGTITVLLEGGFNVLGEYVWGPAIPPDRKPSAVNGERLVVSLTAPADALTMSGSVIVEEG
jgi:hypothetical protein